MGTSREPKLEPGQVYRTRDLACVSSNPTRTAASLVKSGALRKLAPGLFYAPKMSRFGPVPPEDATLLARLLNDTPFVLTGSERWNALGLGTTSHFATQLVYNSQRTGTLTLGNRRYLLRRVRFPKLPTAEWFAIDLLNNHDSAGVDRTVLEAGLRRALERGRLDPSALDRLGAEFGGPEARAMVSSAIQAAACKR